MCIAVDEWRSVSICVDQSRKISKNLEKRSNGSQSSLRLCGKGPRPAAKQLGLQVLLGYF